MATNISAGAVERIVDGPQTVVMSKLRESLKMRANVYGRKHGSIANLIDTTRHRLVS